VPHVDCPGPPLVALAYDLTKSKGHHHHSSPSLFSLSSPFLLPPHFVRCSIPTRAARLTTGAACQPPGAAPRHSRIRPQNRRGTSTVIIPILLAVFTAASALRPALVALPPSPSCAHRVTHMRKLLTLAADQFSRGVFYMPHTFPGTGGHSYARAW
jgi:hypothetical protein